MTHLHGRDQLRSQLLEQTKPPRRSCNPDRQHSQCICVLALYQTNCHVDTVEQVAILGEEVHETATHHVDTVEQVAILGEQFQEKATHHVDDSTTGSVFHYLWSIASMCPTASLNHNSRLTRFCFCSVTQQIVDVGTNFSPASTPVLYPHPLRQPSISVQFSPLSTRRLHSPPYVPISPLHTPYTWTLEPSFNTRRTDLHSIYTLQSSLSERYDF